MSGKFWVFGWQQHQQQFIRLEARCSRLKSNSLFDDGYFVIILLINVNRELLEDSWWEEVILLTQQEVVRPFISCKEPLWPRFSLIRKRPLHSTGWPEWSGTVFVSWIYRYCTLNFCESQQTRLSTLISLINVARVANNRRIWKKYLTLINEGSVTNGGPGIFETVYKETFENSHFLFLPNFFK